MKKVVFLIVLLITMNCIAQNKLLHAEFNPTYENSGDRPSLSFGQFVLNFSKPQEYKEEAKMMPDGNKSLTLTFSKTAMDEELNKKIHALSETYATFKIRKNNDKISVVIVYNPQDMLCICESYDTRNLRGQVRLTLYDQKVLKRLQHVVKPMIQTALFNINNVELMKWC